MIHLQCLWWAATAGFPSPSLPKKPCSPYHLIVPQINIFVQLLHRAWDYFLMNYMPRERNHSSLVLRAIFSMCQIVFALENFFFLLLWGPWDWIKFSGLAIGAFRFSHQTGPVLLFCLGFSFETKTVAQCPWTHCAAQSSLRLSVLLPLSLSTEFQACGATPVLEHSFLATYCWVASSWCYLTTLSDA